MKELFRKRPFKTRNADEYDLNNILSLFINPLEGLRTPLDFENSIIKGRMGSGKTMFLRANYASYLYNIIPSLIDDKELILPVFIKLSDFQHINDASEIYKQLVIKIVEEISTTYLKLQDQKEMANIHAGMKKFPDDIMFNSKIDKSRKKLLKLGSEEYVEKISQEFGIEGSVNYSFIKASAKYNKEVVVELKHKKNPGINDIISIYELLLKDSNGKILLLIDEAGSLDKQFFKSKENDSFFEIFMNQLRTTDFIRTKIAVYPNSYSDILAETRYGDVVLLEENIHSKETYLKFRQRVNLLIDNYLNFEYEDVEGEIKIDPRTIFHINKNNIGDSIEQLINGSAGNYRRLIQLLDLAMNESYKKNLGSKKVSINDSIEALKHHCHDILSRYSAPEKEFLETISKVCKTRGSYRFKFPNYSQILFKYISRSQEYNILNILEQGVGRKGTIYAFDYSYCINQDITTHLISNSEKIDKKRTYKTGSWVKRNVTINDELMSQADLPGKISGIITYIGESAGFINDDNNTQYFFRKENIISSDRDKRLTLDKHIIFYPWKLGDVLTAIEIEIT